MPISSSDWFQGYVDQSIPPIERLKPESPHHTWVLEQLNRRIKASEQAMNPFYDRWRVQERKFQAYMSLPRYEQILKDMNDSGKPPAPAIIVFPYQYAVISTIVTYLSQVFCARKPIFQLGISAAETAEMVSRMETVLQHQADKQKLVARLYQFFMDGELYGLAVMRNIWTTQTARRSVWNQSMPGITLIGGPAGARTSVQKKVYEGADIMNVDPFMFLPDPSVPIQDVATRGEFAFWREFVGRHVLLKEEKEGRLSYISELDPAESRMLHTYDLSNRNLISGGDAHAGTSARVKRDSSHTYMLDQGTIEIIPDDWGLGEETYPVKYLFTIANKKQIIQAVPFDYEHGDHPLVVCEPYTMGYGFGNPSVADYLGPIQDIMSWFIDSHIQNVRAVLNDSLIVDPSRVEIADLKRTGPGRIIRLKAMAIGGDVRTAIAQLPIQDVTQAHMGDLQTFMRIGDTVSAINDNLRGTPTSGRRSATESRITGEAGASRLASHARKYSSQAIVNLAEQMCRNTQQFMDDPFYAQILGQEEAQKILPQDILGEFTFPISDGSLPLDKVAALEQWKEMYLAVQGDPEMRQSYSLPRIFEFIAELGGAPNVQSFRLTPNPMAQPNMMPINELPPPSSIMPTQALGVPASGGARPTPPVVGLQRIPFQPRKVA